MIVIIIVMNGVGFQLYRYKCVMLQVACGSVLSSLYSGHLAPVLAGLARPGPVVVVVCGGNIVNTQLLAQWRQETAGDSA